MPPPSVKAANVEPLAGLGLLARAERAIFWAEEACLIVVARHGNEGRRIGSGRQFLAYDGAIAGDTPAKAGGDYRL